MNPKVAIIILNWNGWKDTIECLESVYKINYDNYNIILVNNGSSDDSIKKKSKNIVKESLNRDLIYSNIKVKINQ